MLQGCRGKDLSAWRPSSFMGAGEQQSWMGLELHRELGNEENRGISHIFLSASPLEPEDLKSKQHCIGERIGQGVGVGREE